MRLFRNLQHSFSPWLALGFISIGVAAGFLVHYSSTDFDRSGFVETDDGLRLIFETQGDGPPLVALAGGPGISHHAFHPYLGHLGDRATVVYFDPRGRGDSDTASTYTVADDVRDLESLRRGLDFEHIDLLGVSYGAHLAVCYALEHPRAVRKLVLVSPIVGRSAWEAHLEALRRAPGMDETIEHIRSRHDEVLLSDLDSRERIMRSLMPLYWCTPEDARAQSHLHRARHRIARQNFEVYEALVGRPFGELNGDLARSDVETRLGEITAPVLTLQGGCDGVLPEGHADWLVENLPYVRKVFIAESGHSPFVDQTAIFVDNVSEFLFE